MLGLSPASINGQSCEGEEYVEITCRKDIMKKESKRQKKKKRKDNH